MLLQRIFTAAVLIVVLLAVLLVAPPVATIVVLTLVVLVGAWEWSVFLRPRALWQRLAYVAGIAVLLGLAGLLHGNASLQRALLWGATLWWLVALAWLLLAPRRVTALAAALAGVLVLVPTFFGLLELRLGWQRGAQLTLFLLVLVWAADTGAFAAGKTLGRHRLAPEVSPGKTWEGLAGGLLAGLLVAWLGARFFQLPPLQFVVLCAVVVIFSVIGDLTESMFKRFAGVKDSGQLIPGHGGMMDRLDSITAAVPVFVLGLLTLDASGSLP